jgi:hypothetical protein
LIGTDDSADQKQNMGSENEWGPTATSKGDGLRLLISNRPIAEAHYQNETPHDTSGRNFVQKRDLTR